MYRTMYRTIYGKYNQAKIYTNMIEPAALAQVQSMCDNKVFEGSKIRIMPDVHSGKGCTIGTTLTISDKVIPNMVGVDIGCGMEVVQLKEENIDLEKLDTAIHVLIPSGPEIRREPHKFAQLIDLKKLRCVAEINEYRSALSIGTLGGGNHFIEADRDEDGKIYLVNHSGSRNLGKEVAEYYQKEAYKYLSGYSKKQIDALIARLKSEGRAKDIQTELERVFGQRADIDPQQAYVSGELFDDYIHDMKLVQQYAVFNRQAMMNELIDALGLTVEDMFTTIHNYIDTDDMILRKGAVSAREGERLLIPINMRDGALICKGKGNEEWNFSAPHGAGRLLSRGMALRMLSMEEFRNSMRGIYSTTVNEKTLDESPMAYKRIEDIIENIIPTVDIIKAIKPICNFKACK